MSYYFFDTCSLLNHYQKIFDKEEKIFISSITLNELENIKTSANKDQDTKYRARQILHYINNNVDKVIIELYKTNLDEILKTYNLPDTNDSKILATALKARLNNEIIFCSDDLACRTFAIALGLATGIYKDNSVEVNYGGYIEVIYDEEDMADFYQDKKKDELEQQLLLNEYLIISDKKHTPIDCWKKTKNGLEKVPHYTFNSKAIGKIKPLDAFQLAAMDSISQNQVSVIRGTSGAGKSLLCVSYLFSQLENNKISKIIIFCNTVATANSARLGLKNGIRLK